MLVRSGPITTLTASAFSLSWTAPKKTSSVQPRSPLMIAVSCFILLLSVSASAVMQETLAVEELQRAPLLVFANKSDCAGALSSDEVRFFRCYVANHLLPSPLRCPSSRGPGVECASPPDLDDSSLEDSAVLRSHGDRT